MCAATAPTAIVASALLLSMVAIYALLSFMITRRAREIGIRMALGATSRQALQAVTGSAMLYLATGRARQRAPLLVAETARRGAVQHS